MKQKQKNLILIPIGWLGNRIRTISAANAFAKQYNRKLKIIWINHDQGMNLPFSQIFEKPDEFEVIELKSKMMWFISQSLSRLARTLKLKNIGKFSLLIGAIKINEQVARDTNTLVIRTDGRFFHFETIPLKFTSAIRQSGDQFISSMSGDFVGMHVRRGNNPKAIENSPTELFINEAKKEIYNNNRKVFLCTDDKKVKKIFKETFGEKVSTRDVVLEHSSIAHTIDAAIDLYCLSRAKKIYGSYYSSFSTISAEFHKVPFVRLKV